MRQGYASLGQTDTGLHMRQRSRAFIVADASDPGNRVVFINAGKIFSSPSRAQIERLSSCREMIEAKVVVNLLISS
jgi:hypothetical protein